MSGGQNDSPLSSRTVPETIKQKMRHDYGYKFYYNTMWKITPLPKGVFEVGTPCNILGIKVKDDDQSVGQPVSL